jgi:hypothetical protein
MPKGAQRRERQRQAPLWTPLDTSADMLAAQSIPTVEPSAVRGPWPVRRLAWRCYNAPAYIDGVPNLLSTRPAASQQQCGEQGLHESQSASLNSHEGIAYLAISFMYNLT